MRPGSLTARLAHTLGECEQDHYKTDARARIGIVFEWANLDTVPSLCNAAELLAARGYKVEFFTYAEPHFVQASFQTRFIEIINHKRRPNRLGIHRFLRTSWSYPIQVWQRHMTKPYRCFIGVDPKGLIHASALARLVAVPVAYYSLELLLSEELSTPAHKQLKEREIALSQTAPFVIIQDAERAQLLADDNRLLSDEIVLVPNSPLGHARRKNSWYWHEFFGLSRDIRIVLHAGNIEPFTGIETIVRSVAAWPERWVLVVHSFMNADSLPQSEKLRELSIPGRVLFSLKPVSRHEYAALVDGANVGVAFYVPIQGSTLNQRNIQAIGLSSGKIAYYLRSGLPVIVNREASVGKLLEAERCGISVGDAEEIGNAIERIERGYQGYSDRACATFDRYLDFSSAFDKVIARIDALGV